MEPFEKQANETKNQCFFRLFYHQFRVEAVMIVLNYFQYSRSK